MKKRRQGAVAGTPADLESPPNPERVAGALQHLRLAFDEVGRLLSIESHPLIRQELERKAESLETQIHAWETQDSNLLEEAARIQQRAPRGLRNLAELPVGTAWLLTEKNIDQWRANGAPGQVWLRWDHLPIEQREDAASFASFLRDLTGKRKPAGRPRRNPAPK